MIFIAFNLIEIIFLNLTEENIFNIGDAVNVKIIVHFPHSFNGVVQDVLKAVQGYAPEYLVR